MNDGIGEYVANQFIKLMIKKNIQVSNSNILILGFTFKENCPDIRNTKVIDIVNSLKEYNVDVDIYDPWADIQAAKKEYGITVLSECPSKKYDGLILAVAHNIFKNMNILSCVKNCYAIFDVKGLFERSIIDGRL
jgi:UDP-N-acetyl-D-galactosamine dehydrogenase